MTTANVVPDQSAAVISAAPVHHHRHQASAATPNVIIENGATVHHLKRVTFGLPGSSNSRAISTTSRSSCGSIIGSTTARCPIGSDRTAELQGRCFPSSVAVAPFASPSSSSSSSFPNSPSTVAPTSSAGSSFSGTSCSTTESTTSSWDSASDDPPPPIPCRASRWLGATRRVFSSTMPLLKRCVSEVSMIMFRATHSGERAWREEYLKYRQTRFSNRRVRKRVIFKHGDCNVVQGNVAKRRRRYMQDIFTTLVDAQWRWTLMVFAMSFLLTWTGFGVVWWIISYAHGDFEYLQRVRSGEAAASNETFIPCVTEIKGFLTCFLFSVETQHTIGYGNRFITDECPEAIFTMCLQCIMGVFIQAFMVGIVFAKLARPIKRAQTLLFSRNAVICHRDGVPCLMFRVGDMRKSHIIEAHVRAQIIRKKVTKEGEVLPFFQQELSIGADGGQDRLMFIWPTTMLHKIDRHSPLYALSAQDMLRERFEIVVMLEGVVESTGMTTQARSSYLPTEILWGHRFQHVVTFRKDTGEYEVDYTLFNNTYDVDTPLCSSKQLDEVRAELHSPNGLERLCSAGLLPRVSSAASLDPPSDESAESVGRLEMRPVPPSMPNGTVFANGHHDRKKSSSRRLSIKQDQLSIDSMC